MNYEQAVTQAATALQRGEDANWELASLTYENTSSSRSHTPEAGKVSMDQWCTDVRNASGRRFGERTGKTYKQMWERHGQVPSHERPDWTQAMYDLTGDSTDRIRERHQSNPDLWEPERKVEAFRKLAADPVVLAAPEVKERIVESVARSPELTVRTLSRSQELRPDPEPRPRSDPLGIDFIADVGVGSSAIVAARKEAARVSRLVSWVRRNRETGELTENTRAAVEEDAEDLDRAAEMLRRYAAELRLSLGGGTTDDAWLRAILNEPAVGQ